MQKQIYLFDIKGFSLSIWILNKKCLKVSPKHAVSLRIKIDQSFRISFPELHAKGQQGRNSYPELRPGERQIGWLRARRARQQDLPLPHRLLQLCILNRKSKHQDLGCPPHPSPPSFSYLKMFSAFCQILKLS